METYHVRYAGRTLENLKIEFKEKEIIQMNDIDPSMEGIPITFNARIIAVDERRTFTESAMFKCPICGMEDEAECDIYRKLRNPRCLNKECKREPMYIKNSHKKTEYIQVLRNTTIHGGFHTKFPV